MGIADMVGLHWPWWFRVLAAPHHTLARIGSVIVGMMVLPFYWRLHRIARDQDERHW